MKKIISFCLMISLVLNSLLTGVHIVMAEKDVYRASAAYTANPVNGGQWSYKYMDSTTGVIGALNYDSFTTKWHKGVVATSYSYPADDSTCVVNDKWQHPSWDYDSIRRWTAPKTGTIEISSIGGTISVGNDRYADGVNVKILKGTENVWPVSGWQTISAGENFSFAKQTVSVLEGETIDFVVNINTNPYADNTIWDQFIVYVDGSNLKNESTTAYDTGTGTVSVASSVYNYSDTAKTAEIIYCLYGLNNKLVSVDVESIELGAQVFTEVTSQINKLLLETNYQYYIKVFIWDSINQKAQPLSVNRTASLKYTALPTPAIPTATPTAPAPGVNIALNKKTYSSKAQTSLTTGACAVDGDLTSTTKWATGDPGTVWAFPQWLTVDLGDNYAIDNVKLYWENAYATYYKVLVSNNSIDWVVVKDNAQEPNTWSTTTAEERFNDITFPAVSARYVRILAVSIDGRANPSWGVSLNEMEVYTSAQTPSPTPVPTLAPGETAPPKPTPIPTPTAGNNLAFHKTVTASSTSNTTYSASNAVDGYDGTTYTTKTRWSSSVPFASPQWLKVDLAQGCSIENVVLKWEAAFGKSYQIQVSNDDQSWYDYTPVISSDGGVETVTLNSPVLARYIRVNITEAYNDSWGVSLWEFEVYPSATLAPTPSPTPTPTPTPTPIPNSFPTPIPNPNLSIGKTATALDVNTAQGVSTYIASKAIDSNIATKWQATNLPATSVNATSWIYVDLGTPTSISYVKLIWEINSCAKAFKLQVSDDLLGTWTDVYETTTGVSGVTGAAFGVSNITFAPVTAKYVRMYGTVRKNILWGFSVQEFEIYANAPNLAIAKATTTSSNTTNNEGSKAVDGLYGAVSTASVSKWISAAADPQSIYVNLGAPSDIGYVKLRWDATYGKSYKIQVSNDASAWTDVFETTAGDGGLDEIPLSTVSAQYVRMLATERGGTTTAGYALQEFEVYTVPAS